MENIIEQDFVLDRCKPIDLVDTAFALVWPILLISVFCALGEGMMHWFIVPLYLCGVIVGFDAIRWIRGKMDTYDPKGIIGLIGMHFFVSAPLLVAFYNADKVGQVYVSDWRPWLGKIAIYSFIGLVFYNVFQRLSFNKQSKTINTYWSLNYSKCAAWVPLFLVAISTLHLVFMFKMGGLAGFIKVRTYGFQAVDVTGWGPAMVFGRSLPIMILIAITLWRYDKLNRSANIFVVGSIIFIFLIIQFFVAGLTGSRSATLWGLFWATGIIHFFWRRLSVKLILIFMIPFITFMYLYGFYKAMGSNAIQAIKQGATIESLSYESGRSFSSMLVGDLSRADVQAAQLYVLESKPWHYRYRFGSTYLTSVVPLIPRKIWPSKPTDAGKVIAGTEMLYGAGTYQGQALYMTGKRSTRVYGLAGEAMLNFGICGIVLVFAIWGYVAGYIRRRLAGLRYRDMRLLTIPFWINICFLILINDVSNHVAYMLYKWLIPAILIFLVSSKLILSYPEQQET